MHKLHAIIAVLLVFLVSLVAVGWPWRIAKSPDRQLSRTPHGYQYKKSVFTGIVFSQFNDGGLKRLLFQINGKFFGPHLRWYDNGQLREVSFFSNGVEDYTRRTWHSTGEPMSFATFRAGKQIGDSWSWYADGSVSFYGFYKNGQEIAIKSFTSQQRPFHNWINDGTQRVGFSGERECDTANYNRAGIKK